MLKGSLGIAVVRGRWGCPKRLVQLSSKKEKFNIIGP